MNTPPSLAELRDVAGVRISTDKDGLPIIESHPTKQIKTLDELLQQANYSLDEWEVLQSVANVWHQMSGANGLVPLWQVKATLRRKDLSREQVSEIIRESIKALRESIRTALPKVKVSPKGKGVMCEFALPDLHLGKLAWSEETGHGSWDLKIARKVYETALDDLIARAPEAEEAWFVIGNDFFNVDGDTKTTTAGTPQDEDGRWQKTFREGKTLIMQSIGRLKKKFPKVKVIVVYGNHDKQRSFYLGELLYEVARAIGDPSLTIDNRPLSRKFYQWGETGIGFTHGDKLKEKNLAHICQYEAREILCLIIIGQGQSYQSTGKRGERLQVARSENS